MRFNSLRPSTATARAIRELNQNFEPRRAASYPVRYSRGRRQSRRRCLERGSRHQSHSPQWRWAMSFLVRWTNELEFGRRKRNQETVAVVFFLLDLHLRSFYFLFSRFLSQMLLFYFIESSNTPRDMHVSGITRHRIPFFFVFLFSPFNLVIIPSIPTTCPLPSPETNTLCIPDAFPVRYTGILKTIISEI